MPKQNREVTPGPRAGTVLGSRLELLFVPAGWELLAPGDAALTRRVKAAGPVWTMSERKGRKIFSLGLYAPKERIESIRQQLALERADPSYALKLERSRTRRAVEQEHYEEDFASAVLSFLAFAEPHRATARLVAEAITRHATPVGSGTVARTKRIPLAERAEAATIAWLRHATTGYDNMQIPRVAGARREVRRLLAERSRELLARYRRGDAIALESCLLRRALGSAGGAREAAQARSLPVRR